MMMYMMNTVERIILSGDGNDSNITNPMLMPMMMMMNEDSDSNGINPMMMMFMM